jgi:transcriptional regulator
LVDGPVGNISILFPEHGHADTIARVAFGLAHFGVRWLAKSSPRWKSMYRPTAFREDRLETLHALIEAHPLGTLITGGSDGLSANLIPFTLAAERGDKGVLRAHLARGNDQIVALREVREALVLFQGAEAYITPAWYVSKAEHGKVVPTWNYVVVQAWGTPRVIDDPAWLRVQIDELTRKNERDRREPWNVSDAPEPFIDAQIRGIVGLEIDVARIEGKWKVSQNRPEKDRDSVVHGLRTERNDEVMASIVSERGRQK